MEDKKIKFYEQELSYKKGLKWQSLSYEEIEHAYLRIEEIKGRLCCGVANFDLYFLVLKTHSGKLVKAEASSQEIVKEMLAELKQKNDKIEIGFKKQEA